MVRTIAIASGKGGVGKTTLVANLGLAIAGLGKKVIMVDADLDMANLELAFKMEGRPITLQDVLNGEARPEDAIYEVSQNAAFMPAGISPTQFRRVDPERLADVILKLSAMADVVLLDCPAGIGKDAIACFSACKETILIVSPEPMSATDAYKTSIAASKMGSDVIGVVLNLLKDVKGQLKSKEIQSLMNVPILASLSYKKDLEESTLAGKPIVKFDPTNQSSIKIKKLAADLIGATYIPETPKRSTFGKLFGFLKRKR